MASDLISRSDAVNLMHELHLDKLKLNDDKNVVDFVKGLPTVDAVEVVRCKDCIFFIDKEDSTYPAGKWDSIDGICWRNRKFTCHDDYCSNGVKMDGEME